MIHVQNVSKEFKVRIVEPGFLGSVKGLFFNKTQLKTAVDDVSFQISAGEIVGYIGSNGAGKSTTIKMLSGILTPTTGSILLNGLNPNKDRKKNASQIGAVFGQRSQLWWDLPTVESFNILRHIYGVEKQVFNERMDFFKDIFSLDEFILQPVRTLSLGQRMKADLVASMLHNPKILFLDEPTIGLDLVSKDNLRSCIKILNERYGTTILITTHDMSDIEMLCRRILLIDNGTIIYDGNIDNLRNQFRIDSIIELEFENDFEPEQKDLQILFPNRILTIQKEGEKYVISHNNFDIDSSTILTKLFGKWDIKKMAIKEPKVEDFIKKLYLGNLK